MNKNKKIIIAVILIMSLLTIQVFAIVPPEDSVPFLSDRELIDQKARELLRVRMQRRAVPEEELYKLDEIENSIIEEMEGLGAVEKNIEEIASILGHTSEQGVETMAFESLLDWDLYRYFISGPYTTTYNGRTVYYMDVLVVPMDDDALMWINYGNKTIVEEGIQFGTYKNTPISTSPATGLVTEDRPVNMFSGLGDGLSWEYSMDVEIATLSKYVYFAESRPDRETSYSLGFITTSIECYEIHYLGTKSISNRYCYTNGYREILDEYYYDIDHALSVYYAGHGYEVGCPMTIYYYFGNSFLRGYDVQQPLSSPYLYYDHG